MIRAIILFLAGGLLAGLLAGCGEEPFPARPPGAVATLPVTASRPAVYNSPSEIIHWLDIALNNGEIDLVMSLFTEDASIEVDNQPYLKYTGNGKVWQLRNGQIDLQNEISNPLELEVQYPGKENVKAYLYSLIANHLQIITSRYEQSGNSTRWFTYVALGNSTLDMQFDITVVNGLITAMTIKNSNMASQ